MMLTLLTYLFVAPAHAGRTTPPSRGAACAALLAAQPGAFADALEAERFTRAAYAAFQLFRRERLGAGDDQPAPDELIAPVTFTTDRSPDPVRTVAARRVRTLERTIEGKRAVDFGPVDFTTDNVRVGFVLPDRAAIEVYLGRARTELARATAAERAQAGLRKPTPDLAESAFIKTVLPKSALVRGALLVGGPVAIDRFFTWFHQVKDLTAWLDTMGEIAAAGEVGRWAHLSLSTDATAAFVTAAALGQTDRAAELHYAEAYRALFGPGERPAIKDLALDLTVFNEDRAGEIVPTLALVLRYQAPRPRDGETAAPSGRWQTVRARLDSLLKETLASGG